MWKRHNAGKDFYTFFTLDGKVDTEDPSFLDRYDKKIIPEEFQKLKDKIDKKNNPKPKVKPEPKIKTVETAAKKRGKPKKEKPVEPAESKKDIKPKIKTETKKPVIPESEGDPELKALAQKATRAKFRAEIAKADKAEIELKKTRSELIEVETLAKTLIGYCMALNQNLLDQPRSFVDKFESGVKTGKSKTALTDILREPAMDAIKESIEMIRKEIKKYKRHIKEDSKVNE